MLMLHVNGDPKQVRSAPQTPLLWVLRDELQLTGTKYGCGMALCGACTVHVDGAPVRSCITRVGSVVDARITTIEGLAPPGRLHVLQQAWIDESVPQCGYCQSGQLMSAAALLQKKPAPSDDDIDDALAGHICRCGTYSRIRKAIHRAAHAGSRESALRVAPDRAQVGDGPGRDDGRHEGPAKNGMQE